MSSSQPTRTASGSRWRLAIGLGQMFGAVAGVTLLFQTGLSLPTLVVAAATTTLSLTSRRLYGRR
jgi:hypothetical protein